jgi:hypothetical protein
MSTHDNNNSIRNNIRGNYSYTNFKGGGYAKPGTNGLTGFQAWECYMIVKYGKNGKFGVGGDSEYLIELPIYPEQVSEQISASWQQQKILGRSAPLVAYANTELKSVSFSMDLHRDFLTGSFSHNKDTLRAVDETYPDAPNSKTVYKGQLAGYQKQDSKGPFWTRSWYTNINKMLQISCYPQYTSSGMMPPTTYFVFGQMILKGYVTNYSTEWKKPILNTFYGWNSVTINMMCYPDSVISARDIISGEGAASTQNTYNTKFPSDVGSSNVMTRKDTTDRSNYRNSGTIGGDLRYV